MWSSLEFEIYKKRTNESILQQFQITKALFGHVMKRKLSSLITYVGIRNKHPQNI
jgi:DNA polymerase III epsilon subunit-like protein